MKATGDEITLPGLQGSSLLGFLAALGTFRSLSGLADIGEARMKWIVSGGSYSPVIETANAISPDDLLKGLDGTLRKLSGHRAVTIDLDLKISGERFRALSDVTVDEFLEGSDPEGAGMVAAFGCDAVTNEDLTICDTDFRTMGGAGHQHFLKFMDDLARETTVEHLREALFGPWRYRDPSPVMRWDSEDDRRYALRWDEPSKDPVRTERGANRLAIAALPCFPVVPTGSKTIATTGFTGQGSRTTFITWPLWSGWLTLDTVRSLLGLQELQRPDCSSAALAPRGICAVYRAQRITLGKYRNFTPGRAL